MRREGHEAALTFPDVGGLPLDEFPGNAMSPQGPHDYVTALRRKPVMDVSVNIDTHEPATEAPVLSAPIADLQ